MADGFVFLGPPGVGKGTQAKVLAERCGFCHVSTGSALRAFIREGTLEKGEARSMMEHGNLVPDERVAQIIREHLSGECCRAGFILDGFPRNLHQAEMLSDILKETDGRLIAVLSLKAPDDELVERRSGRHTCMECGCNYHLVHHPSEKDGCCDECGGELTIRDDDKPDVVRARLAVYRKETEPLISYYRSRGMLREVDAVGTIGEVTARIEMNVI